MLLSDKLLEIGRSSNPKNNLSMGNAAQKMLDECREHYGQNYPMRLIKNVLEFVCDTLNKEGYSYFKVELFLSKGAK